jgi:hypothetical protein
MMSRQEIQNYENDEEDGLLLARSIKISALRIKKKKFLEIVRFRRLTI